jgi:hypothetical protein
MDEPITFTAEELAAAESEVQSQNTFRQRWARSRPTSEKETAALQKREAGDRKILSALRERLVASAVSLKKPHFGIQDVRSACLFLLHLHLWRAGDPCCMSTQTTTHKLRRC